jgi:hypothetical protein
MVLILSFRQLHDSQGLTRLIPTPQLKSHAGSLVNEPFFCSPPTGEKRAKAILAISTHQRGQFLSLVSVFGPINCSHLLPLYEFAQLEQSINQTTVLYNTLRISYLIIMYTHEHGDECKG